MAVLLESSEVGKQQEDGRLKHGGGWHRMSLKRHTRLVVMLSSNIMGQSHVQGIIHTVVQRVQFIRLVIMISQALGIGDHYVPRTK